MVPGTHLLCLITGPSGSGKTSVARELRSHLSGILATKSRQPISVNVIHQDHYFTKPFLPYRDRVDDSYENGSGIDWDGLVDDVKRHFDGDSGNPRGNGDQNSAGIQIVIVEGHILGNMAAVVRQRFDRLGLAVVLLTKCSRETCRRRRLDRNPDRSADERGELARYFDAFVWPSYLKDGIAATESLRKHLGEVMFIEIDNSDAAAANPQANAEEISNRIINELLLD